MEVVIFGYDLSALREVGLKTVERLATELNSGMYVPIWSRAIQRFGSFMIAPNYIDSDSTPGLWRRAYGTRSRWSLRACASGRSDRSSVQLVEPDRGSLDKLRSINVNPDLSPHIPLDAVAVFEDAYGPSEIRRVDQQRSVVISANPTGFDLRAAGATIEEALEDVYLGDGMSTALSGHFTEMDSSMRSLQLALLLAVFLVYVIMASTFENLIHPFVILFSVPLALVGSVLALGLSGTPISVVVLIGWIVPAGLVVNNAIVLVDAVNRLRNEGLDVLDAVKNAAKLRFRPILITTFTTVLGLLPLSLGLGSGAEMQQPLAVAVIGGLLRLTLLTLVVVPAIYLMFSGSRAQRS